MKRQNGVTTLALSLLMLAILGAGSVFMTKAMVAERRLTLNEIEYRLMQAAAEQGLAEAIAQLKVDPDIQTVANNVTHELGEIQYRVSVMAHATLPGIRLLESRASMLGGGRSRVRLALAERTVLAPQQPQLTYPVLLAGVNTVINGALHIVSYQQHAAANQANPSVSSVWAAGNLTVPGALHSCYLADYDAASRRCLASVSQIDNLEQRLEQDLRLEDASFPADILQYIFGYSPQQWRHLEALATAQVTDCSAIKRPGFYIVSGGASCQLDQVLSSRTAPVILLIKDMAIISTVPSQFYGVVIGQGAPSQALSLANGSELFGAVILDQSQAELNGDFSLHYDADVLCILSACQPSAQYSEQYSPFRRLSVVAGSWSDD